MGALKIAQIEYSYVHEEIIRTGYKEATGIDLIEGFLLNRRITSLDDVDLDTAIDFYNMVLTCTTITDTQKAHFASALEMIIRLRGKSFPELKKVIRDRAKRNKLEFFLALRNITDLADIDAIDRVEFERYISNTFVAKRIEYIKIIDRAKLYAIEQSMNDLHPHVLRYENKLIYLTYHPNIAIAKQFEYTQVKEPLFFDFSLNVSEVLKRQVFALLKYDLEDGDKVTTHMLLQNRITPLWYLYKYCVEHEIDDISKVTNAEVEGFIEYLNTLPIKSTTCSRAAFKRIRKFTFLNAPSIDWDASAWFLERFSFTEGRVNPSNPREAFYFDDVEITENLDLLKDYMKYLLGLSQRLSITSIYMIYNNVKRMLFYFDENGIYLTKLTKADLENYINYLQRKDVRVATINSHLGEISKFIYYLEAKECIQPLRFHFEKYRGFEVYKHNDISVSKEDQRKVFEVLGYFPEELRLMFLNLWCLGIRVNEVCTIKGNAYLFDGSTAWFLIYQNKAKREKRIPIPTELYDLMTEYIKRNNIAPDEYVFKAPHTTGPYRSGTFRKQMNILFDKYGISETYKFKPHGYRHTLATELYNDGANIQCIREYLGHSSEDMTKHYIDHLPNKIDKLNEEYFATKNKEGIQWN